MDSQCRKKSCVQRKVSHLDNIDRFILEQLAERSWHLEYESDPEGNEWKELCFDDSIATPFYKNSPLHFGTYFIFWGGPLEIGYLHICRKKEAKK